MIRVRWRQSLFDPHTIHFAFARHRRVHGVLISVIISVAAAARYANILDYAGPNRGWLGKMKAAAGVTGYPAVELMTLCETGTRALLGAVSGPAATGETEYARKLLHLLDAPMPVLMDRGFDGAAFLAEVTRRCGSRSPTPSPPSRAPTPAGPATRPPPKPHRRWSPAPATS